MKDISKIPEERFISIQDKQTNWREIWKRKGNLETNDFKELDGFEDTTINSEEVAKNIIKILDIKKEDKVLEVGCGAGMIAQHLDCNYVGIDYSDTLVKKHIKLLGNSVLVAEANDVPFKDNYFDKVFAFSVLHYLPNKEYAKQVVKEMKRVCKNKDKIFLGDLPSESVRKSHLLFKKTDFEGEILEGFYTKKRFNILLK